MRKTIPALAALALFVSACSTTSTSGTHYYRAANQADQVAISGALVQSVGLTKVTNNVSIMFNGQPVAAGQFAGGSATFSGMHAGKPVRADCTAVAAGSFSYQLTYGFDRTDVKCLVFVGPELASSLMLVP